MRLIDADAYLEKMKSTMRYFTTKNDIAEMPTIDPVHAAGGCYCWECKNGEEWENRNGIKGYKCSLLCADISPEAFCSYGKRREGE